MLAEHFTAQLDITRPERGLTAWLCLLRSELPPPGAALRDSA